MICCDYRKEEEDVKVAANLQARFFLGNMLISFLAEK